MENLHPVSVLWNSSNTGATYSCKIVSYEVDIIRLKINQVLFVQFLKFQSIIEMGLLLYKIRLHNCFIRLQIIVLNHDNMK